MAVAAMTIFSSCEKEEVKEVYIGGTAPVLSSSVSGSIPLSFLTQDQPAVKFSWTNPEFEFASGISSQDVNYTLEIDVTGNGFTGPNKKSVSISKDLSASYTQKEFNIVLSDLKLKLNVAASIDVRLVASLGPNATKLFSNILKFLRFFDMLCFVFYVTCF